jgi:hypothetical protein
MVIKHRQLSRPTVTRMYAPAVDVPALAETLRLWYENRGLEASTVAIPNARMVQCRARQGWLGAHRMTALLTVILQGEGADLLVEIGSARWVGSATAAGVGWFAGLFVIPPGPNVLVLVPAAAAAASGWGAWRVRQHMLSNQTIRFLRETAPTHRPGQSHLEPHSP